MQKTGVLSNPKASPALREFLSLHSKREQIERRVEALEAVLKHDAGVVRGILGNQTLALMRMAKECETDVRILSEMHPEIAVWRAKNEEWGMLIPCTEKRHML